jgi:ribulose-5-phosphate 4-epimerase/fuculose-1-phosphate aldolase
VNYVTGDVRDQLAHVGHAVVAAGLVVGSGGNLSARVPGSDECWVTAAGTWLDRLDRSDFVRVRVEDGTPVDASPGRGTPGRGTSGRESAGRESSGPESSGPEPTTELRLHLATYRVRLDVTAIVHLHPQTVLLLDALGEPIRLITTDHASYLRRVVTTPFRLPGSIELAAEAAGAVSDGTNCVILAQHGCSVLGETIELAHKRALYLEEAARLTYRALAIGRVADLPACPAEFLDRLDSGTSVTV